MRKRHPRFRYFFRRKSGTCMALAYARICLQPLLTHQGRPYHSMADIGLSAVAVYARGVAAEDTDVVEHGGFIDKFTVNVEPGGFRHGKRLAGHHLRVGLKQLEEGTALLVIFGNQFIIHDS